MNNSFDDMQDDAIAASASGSGAERRCKPRIDGDFPATVRGVDSQGHSFEEHTRLLNISASGLYMQMPRPVREGATLFIVFPFPTTPSDKSPASQVAAR